jgi:hypothetical protein
MAISQLLHLCTDVFFSSMSSLIVCFQSHITDAGILLSHAITLSPTTIILLSSPAMNFWMMMFFQKRYASAMALFNCFS